MQISRLCNVINLSYKDSNYVIHLLREYTCAKNNGITYPPITINHKERCP